MKKKTWKLYVIVIYQVQNYRNSKEYEWQLDEKSLFVSQFQLYHTIQNAESGTKLLDQHFVQSYRNLQRCFFFTLELIVQFLTIKMKQKFYFIFFLLISIFQKWKSFFDNLICFCEPIWTANLLIIKLSTEL